VAKSIIRAIVGLAEALNLDLIAEGVETEQQRQTLAELGCSKIQGYLVCRPLPAEAVSAMLHRAPHAGQHALTADGGSIA
jgi:EAL domain-containing protein (putative c-di-GMP-specific phosphodiesterase class I)